MCMPTVKRRLGEPLLLETNADAADDKTNLARATNPNAKNVQRGCLLALVSAYLMSQQPSFETTRHLTNMFEGMSETSAVLSGTWVVVYVLVARFLLTHPFGILLAWWRQVRESTHSALTRVSSGEAMSCIRSSVSLSSVRLLTLAGCSEDRSMISAKEPFLPIEEIARLSLSDIKDIFRYASEIGQSTFERREFTSGLGERVQGALDAIDRATAASGGGAYLQSVPSDQTDIDALHFAAAVRIFAEWRSLRLIPNGSNHRYVFGMGMARRDLIQNIGKIEAAAHSWLCSDAIPREGEPPTSPTLRQILQYEISNDVHRRLPQLEENSGASGILWAKRQLQYQTAIFANTAQIPFAFSTSKDAIIAAYKSTYEDYHGFLVKQIFQSSFEAAPKAQDILRFMSRPVESGSDPGDLADEEGDDFVRLSTGSLGSSSLLTDAIESEPEPNALEEVWNFISDEWNRLGGMVGQCAGVQKLPEPTRNALHSPCSVCCLDDLPPNDIADAVTRVIPSYLSVMHPLLVDLDTMIDKFNMDDPTRV